MSHDVVIVGAGPVGLFLACELRLAGASVVVLERSPDREAPLKELPFGLRGLSTSTIEILDRRGLLADVLAASPTEERRRSSGHFAGIPFSSNATAHVAVTMAHLEGVLSARADTMGVDILRGVEVDGVEQSSDGVDVRVGDRSFPARWVVGCDGGRSVVRKAGRFEFVGTEPAFTGYSVQVELMEPESIPLGRHYTPTGMYVHSQPGVLAVADFDGGAFHRSRPVTLDRVQDVLRRVTGVGVTVGALHLATTWTDRAQQVTSYRRGRVLLAGDAAHVHSPLGGQGLNLGLGDAMNLGWKLGAVIGGTAPIELIDTYSAERHPVGAAVLDWSRAQVAVLEPSRRARALAGIIRDLAETRDGAAYFTERISGTAIRYDLGGAHPLVGRSAPDVALSDGTGLNAALRDGVAVLLDVGHRAELASIAQRLAPRLRYAEADRGELGGASAILVRPDGVVAWASDVEPDGMEIDTALSRWLSAK